MSVECERIVTVTADLDVALSWVRSTLAPPIAQNLVPGASEDERRMLTVLGGLVSSIVPASERVGWPADVLAWLRGGPVADQQVGQAALRAIRSNPDEVLASIYAQLASGENRRSLGTFFTPATEVDLMLEMWSATEPAPSTIVDVGAGVGIFTASAAERWPRAQVFAVDINPVTLGLLALRTWVGDIELRDEDSPDSGVRTVRADFTEWIRDLQEKPGPRLILGNPPYTRSQLMSAEDRARLVIAADGLCGSRASLSALITAISLRHLGAGLARRDPQAEHLASPVGVHAGCDEDDGVDDAPALSDFHRERVGGDERERGRHRGTGGGASKQRHRSSRLAYRGPGADSLCAARCGQGWTCAILHRQGRPAPADSRALIMACSRVRSRSGGASDSASHSTPAASTS